MEHPFFTAAATTRTEALRWLTIAENLLAADDLLGSKSSAARAHDSDPTLSQAEEILAVVDTLLAGERRVGNNQPDLYAVLRLTPQQGCDAGLVSDQYSSLVLLLNPQKNRFPFAEKAFRLVFDAYSVLSDPLRRSLYDKELDFYSQQQQPHPFSHPVPALSQNLVLFGGGSGATGLHGGQSGGVGGSHSAQGQQVYHVQPQVEPVVGGSAQNFMGFTSGYNVVVVSGSGSKSGYEAVSNEVQESYSTFGLGGSVEQLNILQKQSLQNCSRISDETIHNVYVGDETIQNVNVYENVDNVNVSQNILNVNVSKNVHNVNVSENACNVNVSENVGDSTETMEGKEDVAEEGERVDSPVVGDGSTFWTACPYCYYMYEYPSEYADCTLKCQNCKKAFQAVVIPSPPPIVEGQEAYFCCWGFMPFGFSMEDWKKHNVDAGGSGWAPITPLFSRLQMGTNVNKGVGGERGSAPGVYADNNEDFVTISDSSGSDKDWQDVRGKYEKHKSKNAKGTCGSSAKKARVKKGNSASVQDDAVSPQGVELPKKLTSELTEVGLVANAEKQPGCDTKNLGNLDLNVELSIETEEPAMRTTNQRSGSGRGEYDNIEGNGFFEGLDEYLNSLRILNAVDEDKVVKAA